MGCGAGAVAVLTSGVGAADDARGVGSAGGGVRSRGSVVDQAHRHVQVIRNEIASLAHLPLERLSGEDTLALLRDVEAVTRAAYGAQVRLAMEIDERGLAASYDVRSAAHLLHE